MFEKSSLLNKIADCCYCIYRNPFTWLMLLLPKLKKTHQEDSSKSNELITLFFDFFTAIQSSRNNIIYCFRFYFLRRRYTMTLDTTNYKYRPPQISKFKSTLASSYTNSLLSPAPLAVKSGTFFFI